MKTLRAALATPVAAGWLALAGLGALNALGGNSSTQAVQRTLNAKDLTADILPPPLYLIELRLMLGMAVEAPSTPPLPTISALAWCRNTGTVSRTGNSTRRSGWTRS